MTKLLLKIELIQHEEQRYKTAGDWQIDAGGCICIKVSDTGYRMDALLVGIHEAVEAILCDAHNVLEADVDAFDIDNLRSEESQRPGITVKQIIEEAERFKSCPMRKDGGVTVIDGDEVRDATELDINELRMLGSGHELARVGLIGLNAKDRPKDRKGDY